MTNTSPDTVWSRVQQRNDNHARAIMGLATLPDWSSHPDIVGIEAWVTDVLGLTVKTCGLTPASQLVTIWARKPDGTEWSIKAHDQGDGSWRLDLYSGYRTPVKDRRRERLVFEGIRWRATPPEAR